MAECNRSRFSLRFAVTLALLAFCGTTHGFDMDSDEPIRVESDSARLDDRAGTATYTGNVIVHQGETRLKADEVVLRRDQDGLSSMTATGQPATYEQPETDTEPAIYAEGRSISYSRAEQRISFERNAMIRQREDRFRGDVIHYDMEQRVVTATGGDAESETGGRVEMTIQPRRDRDRQDQ